MALHLPSEISIREVGPRDGLQNEDPVPTDAKISLINALSETGLRRIETVSFVRPDAIPQMGDADDVWEGIQRDPQVRYSALAPNLKGAQRAIAAGFTEIEVVISASETHNQKNVNRTIAQSLRELAQISALADNSSVSCEVIVSTSFGCPYEGEVPASAVAELVSQIVDLGITRVSFGDTTGLAVPTAVIALLERIRSQWPSLDLLLHFHNTRGTALANVLVAMDMGVTQFDASVGGLGGCPYAPGASGNLVTEELVHMAQECGISTGVNLEALIDVARRAQEMVGRELPSGVLKAGPGLGVVRAERF